MTERPPKVYAYGSIGRSNDIKKMFEKVGAKNPLEYKFGNPGEIYFVNKNGEISIAKHDSELFYVIESSNDWVELKLRQPKKERKFVITIKEGSSSCNGCPIFNKCSEGQKAKCQIAKGLKTLIGEDFTGKLLDIKEVKPTCCTNP
jgi:hypothetical protein